MAARKRVDAGAMRRCALSGWRDRGWEGTACGLASTVAYTANVRSGCAGGRPCLAIWRAVATKVLTQPAKLSQQL